MKITVNQSITIPNSKIYLVLAKGALFSSLFISITSKPSLMFESSLNSCVKKPFILFIPSLFNLSHKFFISVVLPTPFFLI